MSDGPLLRIAPASAASPAELLAIFGLRGPAARCRCRCQRYRLEPGESFAAMPEEERVRRLEEQAGCGDREVGSSGLVAWRGAAPMGWCAVGPRSDLVGLVRVFTVPWVDRDEDRADPGVWTVSCVLVRAGERRKGVGSALVRAAVQHAREGGAHALEGYPTIRNDVIGEELHVGTLGMFLDAGFEQISAPTKRRVVMRIDFSPASKESVDD